MLLDVKDLSVSIKVKKPIEGNSASFKVKCVQIVQGINFNINRGEIHSLVGESGCGKTVTSLSLARLLPANITEYSGEVLFNGIDLHKLNSEGIRKIRGNKIAYIFQDPFTSLNPLKKIKDQIIEPYLIHIKKNKKEAIEKAEYLLKMVEINDIAERMNSYPSQMSGGILQRISIAMALMCDPILLIADEPTSAIDVTIQVQFIELLMQLQKTSGMAILFISHDISLVANISDKLSVMYAGDIIETGSVSDIIDHTSHPYTKALINSLPSFVKNRSNKLEHISGIVPSPENYPMGCHFSNRCPKVTNNCKEKKPAFTNITKTHQVMCFNDIR